MISLLNDFIFCPASIYFHMVDADTDKMSYGSREQLQGSAIHESIDSGTYSDRKNILQSVEVFSEEYGLVGKIDLFDTESGTLTERKRKITAIYDGQVFQLYAYCFALREMGYTVNRLKIHSMLDNRSYQIPLPEENEELFCKYQKTIEKIRSFSLLSFKQDNPAKCQRCVYEPLCSFSAEGGGQ